MSDTPGKCGLEDILSPFDYQFMMTRQWCRQTRTPFCLTLELTPLCNFHCPMCYVHLSRSAMERRGNCLRATQWLEITRQFADMGLMSVNLSGGEPLLHPDFWEIYEGVSQQGIYPTLFTNGAMLDERVIERLATYPPRTVKLSLYGASNETYRTMCGVENGFDKVAHAVDLLREANIPMHLTTTLVRQNVQDLKGMEAFAASRGLVLEKTSDINDAPRGAESDAAAALLEEQPEELSLAELEQRRHKRAQKPYDLCGGYGSNAHVTWQGHLQICGLTQEEYIPLVEPYDIPSAWRALLEMSDAMKLPAECMDCPDAEFCPVCPANLVSFGGRTDRVNPYLCRRAARRHEAYLHRLAEQTNPDNQ